MPTLPVPLPYLPAGGPLPVSGPDDVRDVIPAELRLLEPAEAPVREAIVAMVTEDALRWQVASAYAAAQSDVTRATGIYLDGQMGEDRGLPRMPGEEDEAYRVRGLNPPVLVAPTVILAAVDAILAPHTTIKAQLFPALLDQWYVHDGTATWHNFQWNATPQDADYADRYYDDRVQAHPGNCWAFTEYLIGRGFVLRVPDLGSTTPAGAYVYAVGTVPDDGFLGDGSDTSGSESDGSLGLFGYVSETSALDVYQAIVGAVESIRGAGVRWELYVDPDLN